MLKLGMIVGALSAIATAGLQAQEYRLAPVASGFENPVLATAAPGSPLLFVVQQNGVISVLEGGLWHDALDLRREVRFGGEAGLLGLALHPEFRENGLAYVSYTSGSLTSHIEAFRFDRDTSQFDLGSRRLILSLDQPARNHNGGMVAFGPDGYLYAGFGDGGGANDIYQNGQNKGTTLGTIARIDVSGGTAIAPPDNPDTSGDAPFAWAYGLRNPWRFSFDGNRLYIGDVGQSSEEEISVIPAGAASSGANLGWPLAEGNSCYKDSNCREKDLVWPVVTYPTRDGCAVTGGYVYRGRAMPELHGTYFYGDFCSGEISSFRYENGAATALRSWRAELGEVAQLSGFGLDGAGELYVTSLSGTLFKLERSAP